MIKVGKKYKLKNGNSVVITHDFRECDWYNRYQRNKKDYRTTFFGKTASGEKVWLDAQGRSVDNPGEDLV